MSFGQKNVEIQVILRIMSSFCVQEDCSIVLQLPDFYRLAGIFLIQKRVRTPIRVSYL